MSEAGLKILVTGAAGSGTTTLGQALAAGSGAMFLDADDFFWLPSDPPYRQRREAAERHALLLGQVCAAPRVVVAGSVMGWGDPLESAFDLVVFLTLDTEVRLERLRVRELRRFGRVDPDFLEWAAQYDAGSAEGRSLALHRQWLAGRSCRVLCVEGDLTVAERLAAVQQALGD